MTMPVPLTAKRMVNESSEIRDSRKDQLQEGALQNTAELLLARAENEGRRRESHDSARRTNLLRNTGVRALGNHLTYPLVACIYGR